MCKGLVRLRNIWNSGIDVDDAFLATLYHRWMLGKVKLIVFSIPQHLVCGL